MAKHVWILDKTYDYEGSSVLAIYGTRTRGMAGAEKVLAERREHFDDTYGDPVREQDANRDLTTWNGDPAFCLFRVEVE